MDSLDDAGADGLGFAEKAAKLGTHVHALRCTWVPSPAFLIDPLLGRCAEGQYRHEKSNIAKSDGSCSCCNYPSGRTSLLEQACLPQWRFDVAACKPR